MGGTFWITRPLTTVRGLLHNISLGCEDSQAFFLIGDKIFMQHRTSISELKLQGGDNLGRALKRAPAKQVAKREELEALFAELKERRREALADVAKNGQILTQDKFSARGALYQVKVINPSLRIAQSCEKQMAALARQLTALPATPVDPNAEALDSLHNMLGMKPS